MYNINDFRALNSLDRIIITIHLKMCGRGVAMQNAIDEVKHCADDITLSNNDDGVADWINRHLDN